MSMTIRLPIEQLKNHPDNVRKSYSNIEELANSIRKVGILQNLTVVPEPGHEKDLDSFYVVIGNRRLMAAKQAGLTKVQCTIIFDMPLEEQIATMMTENMARNDLTPAEETRGIQLLLDLGETEESIANRIGRSRTTVRHRIEIGKLDQTLIETKTSGSQEDGCFQLSLTDMYSLERVKDIKDRNDILKKAKDPANLKYLIDEYTKKKKAEEYVQRVIEAAEAAGIKKATPKQEARRWDANTKYLADFGGLWSENLDKPIVIPRHSDRAFYIVDNLRTSVRLYDEVKAAKKQEKTKEETEAAKREKNRKELMRLYKETIKRRKAFLRDIAAGKYKVKDTQNTFLQCWNLILHMGIWMTVRTGADVLYDVDSMTMEETRQKFETFRSLPPEVQAISIIEASFKESGTLTDWNCNYSKDKGELIKRYYEILSWYGYSPDPETEVDIIEGTHELYARRE